MIQCFERRQRLLPRARGLIELAIGLMDFADAGQGVRLVVAVAEGPAQAERVPVTGERAVVVTEMVVGIAEAVPRARLHIGVAGFMQNNSGLVTVDESVPVATTARVVPAELVQRAAFTGPMPDPAVPIEGLVGATLRGPELPLTAVQDREITQDTRVADLVTEFLK